MSFLFASCVFVCRNAIIANGSFYRSHPEMRFRDIAKLVKETRARPNASGTFLSLPCSVYTANCDRYAET